MDPVCHKNHPHTDITGFVDTELDQLDRCVECTRSVSERTQIRALDKSVANPVFAKDRPPVRGLKGFVAKVHQFLVDHQVTLFFLVENHLWTAFSEGTK